MIVKLLTEHHLEFLSLTGGCGGSTKSTLVKISNCWKSHAMAHYYVEVFEHRKQVLRHSEEGGVKRVLCQSRTPG